MSFVHLHNHTHFSLLDGISKIEPLVLRAKELNMPALAITDHGALYGVIEFYNTCKTAGIKPILGMEAYIAPRSMEEKETKVDSDYFHLTLLAKTFTGYKNLMWLSTQAHLKGFYYKPRIDKALLRERAEGLIALSGCQRGEIAKAFDTSVNKAQTALQEYKDIFGPDNFFIELQRNALGENRAQTELNSKLLELARKNAVSIVATSDCHYIHPEDSEAQDVAVCVGTGRFVSDSDRLDMRGYDGSLTSPEHMQELFKDLPDAIENTEKIAADCEVEIATNQRYFPSVPLPEGVSAEDYLRQKANEEAFPLYAQEGKLPETIKERLEYELDIICKMGFATYFLMVADVVKGAHSLGAITNTRGSAAGSIVGRILGITNVDPIFYELPFERFLTVHRPTPPDIDLDIADNKRDETIDWITQRYGKDKVAQIITFGTMMARAAVRDVGRALGVPYGKCDRIAKMIPMGKQGFPMTIDRALEMNSELKEIYDRDPETQHLIDIAKKLEGCARHASIHAAGIVITPTELTNYMPLQKEPDGERVVTQYDMYALDVSANSQAIGAIKLDLLGIRNLSILQEALNLVEARHNLKIDLSNLPHRDSKTFRLLSDGHTFGVFQMGSSGMTRYLKELKPTNIFDIMAMIALYRPGPMSIIPEYIARKHSPTRVQYFDPRMKDYLERSRGLLVYQDDVLLTAINIAGYTWEEADKLRKAMGKKIPSEMAKQKFKFVEGAIAGGMKRDRAEELFKLIEPFAAYGFNKAHAASYSQTSYQTAYLKANYPVEFMAAVMTAESGDEIKIYEAVEECEAIGIKVLPPDVNESQDDFTVTDDHTIRFGLNAIKNLGSDVVQQIKTAQKDGPFANLEDFLIRIWTKNLNKKSWEALVKAGALDSLGERGQLLFNTESVLEFLRETFQKNHQGQSSLFGTSSANSRLKLKETSPATKEERLMWEKEHLGLYVSAHPLDSYAEPLKNLRALKTIHLEDSEQMVLVGGLIAKLKRILTKKNEPMAFFTLEDRTMPMEVLVFPKLLPQVNALLNLDTAVQINARVSDRDGEIKLIAESIEPLPNDATYIQALGEMEKSQEVVIYMENMAGEKSLNQIKDILVAAPGNAQVYLHIGSPGSGKKIKTKSSVRISSHLVSQLKTIPEVTLVSDH